MNSRYDQPYLRLNSSDLKLFKETSSTKKLGKENKEQKQFFRNSSISDYSKKLLRKSYEEIKLQKYQVKELYSRLKAFILPERQKILQELVTAHQKYSSIKSKMKDHHSKSIFLQGAFNQLQKQKKTQQKALQKISDTILQLFAKIQQNHYLQQALSITNKQLQQQEAQKQIRISEIEENYKRDRENFNNQNTFHSKMHKYFEKNDNYSVQNDLEIEKRKKFIQNAKIHQNELRNCLSSRLKYLIELKQSTREKQEQFVSLNNENILLQDKINLLALSIQKVEEEKQNFINELAQEEFKLNSVQIENIQLRARLEILQHSFHDQINQTKSSQQNIEAHQNLVENSHSAVYQTQFLLEKLIAVKLESQYLENKLKQTLKE